MCGDMSSLVKYHSVAEEEESENRRHRTTVPSAVT